MAGFSQFFPDDTPDVVGGQSYAAGDLIYRGGRVYAAIIALTVNADLDMENFADRTRWIELSNTGKATRLCLTSPSGTVFAVSVSDTGALIVSGVILDDEQDQEDPLADDTADPLSPNPDPDPQPDPMFFDS